MEQSMTEAGIIIAEQHTNEGSFKILKDKLVGITSQFSAETAQTKEFTIEHGDEIAAEIRKRIEGADVNGGVLEQYRSLGMNFLDDGNKMLPSNMKVEPRDWPGAISRYVIGLPGGFAPPRAEVIVDAVYKGGQVSDLYSTVHEVAHCFNAYGYEHPKPKNFSTRFFGENLSYETREDYSALRNVFIELHSIMTGRWLTGFSDSTIPRTAAEIPRGSMLHQSISTHMPIDELTTLMYNDGTPDENKYPSDAYYYDVMKEAYKNYLRMLSAGMTMGEVGTFIGKADYSKLAKRKENSNTFINWEERIAETVRQRNKLRKGQSTEEILAQLDSERESILARIDRESKHLKESVVNGFASVLIKQKPEFAAAQGITESLLQQAA